MKIKPNKSRLNDANKTTKFADESAGLMDLDSNHIINLLENNMKLRETPIAERLKKRLLK